MHTPLVTAPSVNHGHFHRSTGTPSRLATSILKYSLLKLHFDWKPCHLAPQNIDSILLMYRRSVAYVTLLNANDLHLHLRSI